MTGNHDEIKQEVDKKIMMVNATVVKEESYLIRKPDSEIHKIDQSGRKAVHGRGTATRQQGKVEYEFKHQILA